MPKKIGFEIPGEFLALQLFDKVGKSVTPDEINKYVCHGNYSSKYISFLRSRYGFEFTVTKNGRNVLHYTLTKEPANVVEVRAKAADVIAKTAKTIKLKESKVSVETSKVKPTVKSKTVMTHTDEDDVPVMDRARKSSKKVDEVESTFASSFSIDSYSVDADWDQVDELNIKHLI